MPPVAVAEISRAIQQHIALQRDLAELGFLPPGAAIDGVYGPATRSAILAWQRARGRTPTAFLSDDEARLVTGEATAHRSGATTNSQPGPQPSDPYSKGMADWRDLKAWSDAQTGETGAGVRYWEASRNVAGHASCAEAAARHAQAAGDKSAFLSGCEEAKRRLDPVDARRQSDGHYRAGFSGGAKAEPLSPAGSLVPGTIVPPPPRDSP
jgi:peptidoglycan hydrolase-like protein with peptidoglycan-binding domain